MEKRFFELIVLLVLNLECLGMNPDPGLYPADTYAMAFGPEAQRYFPPSAYNFDTKKILDLILDYSLVLVLLENTVPTQNKDYNHDSIGLCLTPNFRVIDLKYFLARALDIPTQKFNMCFAKGRSVETNPLALVVDKIPAKKKVVIKAGPPVQPIPYKSCPHCLHTVASTSGGKTFIWANKFQHSPNCSKRPAIS